jgi:hypothetical protein
MLFHFSGLVLIGGLVGVAVIYPFLPGSYDAMAFPLSALAQAFGVLGSLLIAPLGVMWLIFEYRESKKAVRTRSAGKWRSIWSGAALGGSTLVGIAMLLCALMMVGYSVACLGLIFGIVAVARAVSRVRKYRIEPVDRFHVAPLYLVGVPLGVLAIQLLAVGPATEFGRRRAMEQAAELIRDIEASRESNGFYPTSLAAVNNDYNPMVVGVERFHYAKYGDAYNLYFEQPRFVFDDIGTREFVVYNPTDERFMISHAAWHLSRSPTEVEANQGWYDVQPANAPHWHRFLFD